MTVDLRALIEAVEAGTFLTGEWGDIPETVAYEAFGGSIDAAVRCVGYLLPEWLWAVYATGLAIVHPQDTTLGKSEFVPDVPVARALLLAALRAKMGEGE